MSLECIKPDLQFNNAATASPFDAAITPLVPLMIETHLLRIDTDYQRGISDRGRSIIKKIILKFDWLLFGVLTVAEKEGGELVVIDGQHRAIAAHHLGVSHVPALVQPMEKSQQATTFLDVNTTRTSIGPIDKFRARVTSGDEFSKALSGALDVLKIKMVSRPGYVLQPREMRSIGAAQTMAKKFGIGTFQTAIEMMIDAQPDVEGLLSGFAMHSTVRAVDRVIEGKGDIERLQTVLEGVIFDVTKDKAHQLQKMLGGQVFLYGAKLLMREYNKGLRQPLSEAF